MSDIFAHAGERVTDGDGNTVCFVARDLDRHGLISVDDFEDWRVPKPAKHSRFGETPGFRTLTGKAQVCIEGEWRPAAEAKP